MKDKSIDVFQIVGFSISTAISVGLILLGKNTLDSVVLGVTLAILTQLFDLQIRQMNSEKKIIRNGNLGKILYRDNVLLKTIEEICENYEKVNSSSFNLFRERAKDSLEECHDRLKMLSEGKMEIHNRSKYSFGVEALNTASKSLKHSAALKDLSYWESTYARRALSACKKAIERNVNITRIFIQTKKEIDPYISVLKEQENIGIKVLVADPQELPKELVEEVFIMDDTAFASINISVEGGIRKQEIFNNQTEVKDAIKNFDSLKLYARPLSELL